MANPAGLAWIQVGVRNCAQRFVQQTPAADALQPTLRCGFRVRLRRAAQGGQAKRDLLGLLHLIHPVLLGHADKRFEGIGTDREADLVETQRGGGLELVLERARKVAAHRLRGDGVEKRLTRGQRVVREALGFEQLLARQKRHGLISKPLDQGVARGERVETGAPLRQGGVRLGTASGREVEQAIGPGDQTVHMHEARFGWNSEGREASQKRVVELARDAAARGHQGGACRGIWLASRAHMGHGVGDSVNGGTRKPRRIQPADGFVQLAARVFAVRRWATPGGDEALEQVRDAFTRPGRGHRHRETPHLPEAGSRLVEGLVMGVERQDGPDRAAA